MSAITAKYLRTRVEAAASRATRLIAAGVPRGRTIIVSEYPRSGGTWLSRMLAHYFKISHPQHTILPILRPAAIHNHWTHHAGFRNPIYLVRDGRDVMVSLFFYRLRSPALRENRYRVFGGGLSGDKIVEQLPEFIELEMQDPVDAVLSWPDHVMNWWEKPDKIIVTYEALLKDTAGTLGNICRSLAPTEELHLDRIHETVETFSFERMSGRKPGQEDRSSFLRKGISGDWRNYFRADARKVFDRYAGQVLITTGYEPTNEWVAG